MRKLLFSALALLIALISQAQPTASEGTTKIQRTTQPAAIIEVPYVESVVNKAIDDYMSLKGYRGTDALGCRVFRNYQLRPSHDHKSDLYFTTERKGRKEKDVTIITLVVGRNNEDIKQRTGADNSSLDGATDLLNDMVASIDAYNLEVQIKDQEDIIKKAQKKYDGLLQDQADYEKKIKSLQDKIEENRKNQQKQLDELNKQKGIMETLRGKKKS